MKRDKNDLVGHLLRTLVYGALFNLVWIGWSKNWATVALGIVAILCMSVYQIRY